MENEKEERAKALASSILKMLEEEDFEMTMVAIGLATAFTFMGPKHPWLRSEANFLSTFETVFRQACGQIAGMQKPLN